MAEALVKARDPAPSSEGELCDLCGAPTMEIRCQVICNRCGYTRDCSDP